MKAPTLLLAAALAFDLLPQPAMAAAWVTNGPVNIGRYDHSATLLDNGLVLIAGGGGTNAAAPSSAELYNPATGNWTLAGTLATGRFAHTATLLPNGKVLVAGGQAATNNATLASAELFDPLTATWTNTGSMVNARQDHTATLLANGKVLVAGGGNGVELYDPATGIWTTTGSMTTNRAFHTATLLTNGQVLVTGGGGLSSAELYDPVAQTWAATGSMAVAHQAHSATLLPNGNVLVTGGNNGLAYVTNSEIYNPVSKTWTATGGLAIAREWHTATLLPDGNVLAAGGFNGSYLADTELFNPTNGTWTILSALNSRRALHTATLLANGQVLVAGGEVGSRGATTNMTETYDSAVGSWAKIGSLTTGREFHTVTLLPNGKVLLAGGFENTDTLANAELYDPVTGLRTGTGSLNAPRARHTATLLPNGQVLAAGGVDFTITSPDTAIVTNLSSAELYNPADGAWHTTGSLTNARFGHTATLLANGKILVAGGATIDNFNLVNDLYASAELYDPASGTWSPTGPMNFNRTFHSATLLPSGKVLVAGGDDGTGSSLASVEIYDPATGAWSMTGNLITNREAQAATLLPNGKVLFTGGSTGFPGLDDSELYDPATGTSTPAGQINPQSSGTGTFGETYDLATLLPNGKVLAPLEAMLYDPAVGKWTATAATVTNQDNGTAVLLPNGKALLSGGNVLFVQELYDAGLGFSNSWQPQIISLNSPLNLGGTLAITGSQFRGIAEGSGGNGVQDSSADIPVVQLRALENSQTLYLSSTSWTTNSYISVPVTNFPTGWAMATVFVNGIPGASVILFISSASPTAIVLTNPTVLANGSFQFAFTNTPGVAFSALAATNLSQPLTNWTVLGGVTESPAGHFQFTDPQATNFPQRFYSVHSP